MSSIRSSSQNSATTGTAISIAAPTGTTTGDVVVVTVHGNQQTTIVDNNGSTPFTEDLNDYEPNVSSGHVVSVFSRRIIGGDPSTYNFTLGSSGRWSVVAVTIQNPHPTDIYDIAPNVLFASNLDSPPGSSDATAPTITTLTANAIHFASAYIDASTDDFTGWPSGYTVQQSVDDNQAQTVTTKVIAAAGITGAQSFTHNGTGTAYIGLSFAIKDSGGSPSASVSPSVSPSASLSPSASISPSSSASRSLSPSASTSPSSSSSRSLSPSASLSPSSSASASASRSLSPSPSASRSLSPSASLSPSSSASSSASASTSPSSSASPSPSASPSASVTFITYRPPWRS